MRDPEQIAVDFNAVVLGTRPARVVIGTVSANGASDQFTTEIPGPDLVVLFVGGIPVDVGRLPEVSRVAGAALGAPPVHSRPRKR